MERRWLVEILVLEGDGVGPEICAATVGCLERMNREWQLGLSFRQDAIGFASLERHGTTLTDAVVERARAAQGILLGPVSHAEYPPHERGGLNPSAEIRKRLDLHANIRPSRARPAIPALARALDLVVVRQNTEGFYADRNMAAGSGEFMPTEDVALAVRKVTRSASRRVAETAFRLAEKRRGRVTAVHKANVLHLSDGLFLEEVRKVARRHPGVALDDCHIDAMAAQLVRTPERFDVILTTNMFGDILSNLASELAGSLGLASALNAGDANAAAQAGHGSAPDIAGRGVANPTGLLLSSALLLDWMGEHFGRPELRSAGGKLNDAVEATLAEPSHHTRDLGGRLGTEAFAGRVMEQLFA
jgi:3-isopropylmalate dehydrogenase